MGRRKVKKDVITDAAVNASGKRYFRKMLGRINVSDEWGKDQGIKGFYEAIAFLAEKVKAGKYDLQDLKDFTIKVLDEFSEIINLDLFENMDMDDWRSIPNEIKEMLLERMTKRTVDELFKGEIEKIFVLDSVTSKLLQHDYQSFLFFRRKIRESMGKDNESDVRQRAIEKQFK